jgi:hypothetical protein
MALLELSMVTGAIVEMSVEAVAKKLGRQEAVIKALNWDTRLSSTQAFDERPLCSGWQQGRSTLALRGWAGYYRLIHLDTPH